MKEKMLKADVKKTKKTIPVEITPYTVSICPVNDWREKGCFYHVVATTKDGKQYSIGELPLTDDRKGAEKRNILSWMVQILKSLEMAMHLQVK